MTNNIIRLPRTLDLSCTWVTTGNPKAPLACVWTGRNPPQPANAPVEVEAGKLYLYA